MTLIVGLKRHGQLILAADTMCTSSDGWGQKFRGCEKITKLVDGAISFCGNISTGLKIDEAVAANPNITCTELLAKLKEILPKKHRSTGIMLSDKLIHIYGLTPFTHSGNFYTEGSGKFVGLGVLEALYDLDKSNDYVLEKTFEITAKNINTVGKYYSAVYKSL